MSQVWLSSGRAAESKMDMFLDPMGYISFFYQGSHTIKKVIKITYYDSTIMSTSAKGST